MPVLNANEQTESGVIIMAKKEPAKKPAAAAKAAPKSTKASTTTVRNTAVPKAPKAKSAVAVAASTTAATIAPTYDQICKRAYELYTAGTPGTEADHWFQAERELSQGV
jgi:cytochrome c5